MVQVLFWFNTGFDVFTIGDGDVVGRGPEFNLSFFAEGMVDAVGAEDIPIRVIYLITSGRQTTLSGYNN